MSLSAATRTDLMAAAGAVRQHAYAPYSKYFVGAAVLTDRGQIHVGSNVENSSYGLTICAERAALCAAVAAGARAVTAVAIVAEGAPAPCGACRQVLAEFGSDMILLLVDSRDNTLFRTTTLSVLLPDQFRLQGTRVDPLRS